MSGDGAPTCPVFDCRLDDVTVGEPTDSGTLESDLEEVVLERDGYDRRTAFLCGSCSSILGVSEYPRRERYLRRSNPSSPSEEDLLADAMACPACGEHVVPSYSGEYRASPIRGGAVWSRVAYCPECDAILGTFTQDLP